MCESRPETLSWDLRSCPGCSHGAGSRVLRRVQGAGNGRGLEDTGQRVGGGSESSFSSAGSEAQRCLLFVKLFLSVEKIKLGNGFKKKKGK